MYINANDTCVLVKLIFYEYDLKVHASHMYSYTLDSGLVTDKMEMVQLVLETARTKETSQFTLD